jgi:hypothetical protein
VKKAGKGQIFYFVPKFTVQNFFIESKRWVASSWVQRYINDKKFKNWKNFIMLNEDNTTFFGHLSFISFFVQHRYTDTHIHRSTSLCIKYSLTCKLVTQAGDNTRLPLIIPFMVYRGILTSATWKFLICPSTCTWPTLTSNLLILLIAYMCYHFMSEIPGS